MLQMYKKISIFQIFLTLIIQKLYNNFMKIDDLKTKNTTIETDKKPNFITAVSTSTLIAVDLIVLLLNEFDVFKIDKVLMRVCMLTALFIVAVPIFLCFYKKTSDKPWVKFLSISLVSALCFFEYTFLSLHAMMLVVLPLILSTQYKNKVVTRIATAGSLTCSLIAPLVGYGTGVWGQDHFFSYLAKLFQNYELTEVATARNPSTDIMEIILFIELPMSLIIVSFALIMFFVTDNNIKGLESQQNYLRLSREDKLTGLLNQSCYQDFINNVEEDITVGVIFFDINKMKATNDTMGHTYGDLLITRSAQSILNVVDDKSIAFRIGGDEFLLISKANSVDEIIKKQAQWKNSLYQINLENKEKFLGLECDVASGYSFGNLLDIQTLVREADEYMYKTKPNMIR